MASPSSGAAPASEAELATEPAAAPAGPTRTTPSAASPPNRPSAPRPAPAGGPASSALTTVLLAMVALLLVGGGYLVLTLTDLRSQVRDLRGQAQANGDQLQTVTGQIKVVDDAEKQLALRLDAQAAADPAAIAAKVQPSVWTISTRSTLGSGWVVVSDGVVSKFITNYHVVAEAVADGSNMVKVFQDQGAQLDGVVEQFDVAADLALVTVLGGLAVLSLSNETPLPGAPVLVVGSPLGLGGSVTTGSISAVRDIDGINYIQFSAPISPGNSGGPLVNGAGLVVGVTVAKVIISGAEGIGLAIPVSQVCDRLKFCP